MPARKIAARPRKVKPEPEPEPASQAQVEPEPTAAATEPESTPALKKATRQRKVKVVAEPLPPLTAAEAKPAEQTPGQVEDLEKDLAALALPRICSRCKAEKPAEAFPVGARKTPLKICIDCRTAQAAKAKDTPSPIEGQHEIGTQAE